ncbi:MAG: class I lanthipeptide [Candidatus Sulfotelmatobacter sp.]
MKKQKKLAINKVTLRNLDEASLRVVAGGATNTACSDSNCPGNCVSIQWTNCNRLSYCVCATGIYC